MGIEDRNYYRDEPPRGLAPSWNGRSAIATIIIINVAVFVANALFGGSNDALTDYLVLPASLNAMQQQSGQPERLERPPPGALEALEGAQEPSIPWYRYAQQVYGFLTYGFTHDPSSIWHILFNMVGLWMLGRAVEEHYSKPEFFRIYLLSVLVCGFVWYFIHRGENMALLGASGAVCTIYMLFVFNFPKTQLLIWGIVPMPAWVLGVALVVFNITGDASRNVAFDVHLTGVAFAAAYFFLKWNFGRLGNLGDFSPAAISRRRKLKLHQPSARTEKESEEADRILAKIHASGQSSLTSRERRFMEKYSKRVRKQRDDF
jgi:membrane associated rhomboid family serine protease